MGALRGGSDTGQSVRRLLPLWGHIGGAFAGSGYAGTRRQVRLGGRCVSAQRVDAGALRLLYILCMHVCSARAGSPFFFKQQHVPPSCDTLAVSLTRGTTGRRGRWSRWSRCSRRAGVRTSAPLSVRRTCDQIFTRRGRTRDGSWAAELRPSVPIRALPRGSGSVQHVGQRQRSLDEHARWTPTLVLLSQNPHPPSTPSPGLGLLLQLLVSSPRAAQTGFVVVKLTRSVSSGVGAAQPRARCVQLWDMRVLVAEV